MIIASRRSAFRQPAVLVPLALLAFAGVVWGVASLFAAGEVADARARLLADVDATLAARPVAAGELSRLVAALRKLPDHDSAHDLLAAQARIELERDRPDSAQKLFLAIASRPGATPDQQRLGARILLRLQEAGGVEPAVAIGWLAQAADLAEAAARASGAADDLLRAWQAAERSGQHERARAFARQLAEQHAGRPEAEFVALTAAFGASTPVDAVDQAVVDLAPPPVEALALRAFAQLQGKDMNAATATAEQALLRAPGVFVVRWAAAVVFHACVSGHEAGSAERARWVARRDPQLEWVSAWPNVSEPLRKQCAAMRELR